jgi:hypothetical protein
MEGEGLDAAEDEGTGDEEDVGVGLRVVGEGGGGDEGVVVDIEDECELDIGASGVDPVSDGVGKVLADSGG